MSSYISASELASLLRSGAISARKLAIIDVRDDDFAGGNIRGARNIPSMDFAGRVDSLVKELSEYDTVVFHCALSQQRGPKAARMYAEAKEDTAHRSQELTSTVATAQRILVLRGGYGRFLESYKFSGLIVAAEASDTTVRNLIAYSTQGQREEQCPAVPNMSKRDSKDLAPTKSRERDLKPSTSRNGSAGDSLYRTKSHELMESAKKQHGDTHKVPRDSTWKSWFGQRKDALEAFEKETKAAMQKATSKTSST